MAGSMVEFLKLIGRYGPGFVGGDAADSFDVVARRPGSGFPRTQQTGWTCRHRKRW